MSATTATAGIPTSIHASGVHAHDSALDMKNNSVSTNPHQQLSPLVGRTQTFSAPITPSKFDVNSFGGKLVMAPRTPVASFTSPSVLPAPTRSSTNAPIATSSAHPSIQLPVALPVPAVSTTTTTTTSSSSSSIAPASTTTPAAKAERRETIQIIVREKTCMDRTWQVVAVVIGGALIAASLFFAIGTVAATTQAFTWSATAISIANTAMATTTLATLWGAGLTLAFCVGVVMVVLALSKGTADLQEQLAAEQTARKEGNGANSKLSSDNQALTNRLAVQNGIIGNLQTELAQLQQPTGMHHSLPPLPIHHGSHHSLHTSMTSIPAPHFGNMNAHRASYNTAHSHHAHSHHTVSSTLPAGGLDDQDESSLNGGYDAEFGNDDLFDPAAGVTAITEAKKE